METLKGIARKFGLSLEQLAEEQSVVFSRIDNKGQVVPMTTITDRLGNILFALESKKEYVDFNFMLLGKTDIIIKCANYVRL